MTLPIPFYRAGYIGVPGRYQQVPKGIDFKVSGSKHETCISMVASYESAILIESLIEEVMKGASFVVQNTTVSNLNQ